MLGYLLLAVLLGLAPAAIASGKGRSFLGWWIFGALLFIVALPAALLIAPRQETRPCPECAEPILPAARKCKHCGSAVAPFADAGQEEARPQPTIKAKIILALAIAAIFGLAIFMRVSGLTL